MHVKWFCPDVPAPKITCAYKTVTVGPNLYCLIYNVLNDFVLSVCFGSTQRI